MIGLPRTEVAVAPVVMLTAIELEIAAIIATRRQCQNLFALRPDKHGAPVELGWQLHIEGAAGEMAVAKWSGRYWNGNLGNLDADDVGRVQVRASTRHDGRLILHPDDPADRAFILVTGMAPRFVLRGWCWGHEGKRKEFWTDPKTGRPAFFVPQSALRPCRLPQ